MVGIKYTNEVERNVLNEHNDVYWKVMVIGRPFSVCSLASMLHGFEFMTRLFIAICDVYCVNNDSENVLTLNFYRYFYCNKLMVSWMHFIHSLNRLIA